jgi:hypothetical protein
MGSAPGLLAESQRNVPIGFKSMRVESSGIPHLA